MSLQMSSRRLRFYATWFSHLLLQNCSASFQTAFYVSLSSFQVRDQAFKALRGFLEKLEKASENPEMIPELEAQVQAGGKSGLLSNDKVSFVFPSSFFLTRNVKNQVQIVNRISGNLRVFNFSFVLMFFYISFFIYFSLLENITLVLLT